MSFPLSTTAACRGKAERTSCKSGRSVQGSFHRRLLTTWFSPCFCRLQAEESTTRIDPYNPVFDWCSGHGFWDRFFRRIHFECLELIRHQSFEIQVFRFVGQDRGTILQPIGIMFPQELSPDGKCRHLLPVRSGLFRDLENQSCPWSFERMTFSLCSSLQCRRIILRSRAFLPKTLTNNTLSP